MSRVTIKYERGSWEASFGSWPSVSSSWQLRQERLGPKLGVDNAFASPLSTQLTERRE
jgi:hypothetical protein